MKGYGCVDAYYQELHDLIKHICPQMIEHYIPIIALMQSPENRDPFGLENRICLLSDNNNTDFLSISVEKSFDLDKPESFISAKLLNKMLGELPEDAAPAVRQVLEERRDIFQQLESPSHFRTLAQQEGLPAIDKVGKSVFCMSQPIGTMHDFKKLSENGTTPKKIRSRYLHYEAQCFINELFGTQSSETEFPFTNFPPDYHNEGILPKDDREIIVSAFFTALLKETYPSSIQHVILRSDVSKYRHCQEFQQLFIIVNSQFVQAEPLLICPSFSNCDNSFLQQVIQVFFQKWHDIHDYGLYHTDSAYIMDMAAIIRLAVRDLTEGRGLPSYTLFDQISATRSEGNVCYGTLVFSEDETAKDLAAFSEPVALQPENVRYMRKLLEMTDGDSDDGYVLFVNVKDSLNPEILGLVPRCNCGNLYTVEFYGLLKWTLRKGQSEILSSQEGVYLYRQRHIDKELNILRSFLGCTDKDMDTVHHILETVWDQKRGTMVIIFRNSADAETEAERLTAFSRGIRLKEAASLQGTERDRKLLLSLSAIDGAIILDQKGFVWGFGIIVDGEASVKGTPHRGARYNSANNYVACCEQKGIPCAALVISEDRSLDVLLPPNYNITKYKRKNRRN